MRNPTSILLLALLAGLAAVPVAGARREPVPAPRPALTAMRSWSSPTGTRVVLDFSVPVSPVAPDSGRSRSVVVSVPGEPLARAEGVPAVLGVRDGLVDSVEAATGANGARFQLWFRDSTRFKVFVLLPEGDKPFRVVVDVQRPGGQATEDRRLAAIAAARRTPKGERVRVVAVDAGHGGEDIGARGPRGVLEKWTNLAIVRGLAEELNRIPGVRALLTRDGDYFIPLRERYHIAEKAKADLFISIHANSSPRRGNGSGTEVFFLSLRGASDQADRDLADAENAADLVGGVPPQAENDLVSILYDVKRTSALQQSQLLAETLLDHVAADRRIESRGIKQAGFVVLKSVEFPSVLVETAFINNPVEARLLKDPEFQRRIAHQLATGVKAYFEKSGIGLTVQGGDAAPATGGSGR
ncbi:MAG: N-acetylmuramoyl-L-alanine amidase [Candidatus Eisenbacteria bacterium]|nr:N-acetylmuramoyl-L-alanine amidase [Candidatus Eisenbacteria bacterium]